MEQISKEKFNAMRVIHVNRGSVTLQDPISSTYFCTAKVFNTIMKDYNGPIFLDKDGNKSYTWVKIISMFG